MAIDLTTPWTPPDVQSYPSIALTGLVANTARERDQQSLVVTLTPWRDVDGKTQYAPQSADIVIDLPNLAERLPNAMHLTKAVQVVFAACVVEACKQGKLAISSAYESALESILGMEVDLTPIQVEQEQQVDQVPNEET
jgi:hypothetical protein